MSGQSTNLLDIFAWYRHTPSLVEVLSKLKKLGTLPHC